MESQSPVVRPRPPAGKQLCSSTFTWDAQGSQPRKAPISSGRDLYLHPVHSDGHRLLEMMQQESAKDELMLPLDCPFTSILGQLSAKQDPSSRQALGWWLKVGVLYPLPQSKGLGVRGPVWRRPPARLQKGPRPRLLLTPVPTTPSIHPAQVPWALPPRVGVHFRSFCLPAAPSRGQHRGGEGEEKQQEKKGARVPEVPTQRREEVPGRAKVSANLQCLERAAVTGNQGHRA